MRHPKNRNILVQRVKKIFDQFENGRYTFTYESYVSRYAETSLPDIVRECQDEKLILFYYDASCWTLLTDCRVFWCDENLTFTLNYGDIADAAIIPYEKLNASSVTKLYVICLNNEIFHVPIETGPVLFAFLKIFSTIPLFFAHDFNRIEYSRSVLKERISIDKNQFFQ